MKKMRNFAFGKNKKSFQGEGVNHPFSEKKIKIYCLTILNLLSEQRGTE